jgi:hypothetical protein
VITPAAVHHRHAQALFAERQRVLAGAYTERLSGSSVARRVVTAVWITKPNTREEVAQ